jgi:hypothetical protein
MAYYRMVNWDSFPASGRNYYISHRIHTTSFLESTGQRLNLATGFHLALRLRMCESVLARHGQEETLKLHILTFTTSNSFKHALISNQMNAETIFIDWSTHQHT